MVKLQQYLDEYKNELEFVECYESSYSLIFPPVQYHQAPGEQQHLEDREEILQDICKVKELFKSR